MNAFLKGLAVLSLLTVNAYAADGNGPSNIIPKGQMMANYGKGDELLSVEENYTYGTVPKDGGEVEELKGTVITIKACGFPTDGYASSRDSAHLRVLGGLISVCSELGYDSYSVNSATTGGAIGLYYREGTELDLYYVTEKKFLEKQLHQVCFTGQGICK